MPGTEPAPVGTMLASLPAMLGFIPTESLVLLPILPFDGGHVLGPPITHVALEDVVDSPRDAGAALSPLYADLPLARLVIVLTTRHDHGPAEERPYRTELARLLDALHDDGITDTTTIMVSHFTEGASWYCYDDPFSCGTLPDPATTVAAATAAAAGLTVAASRDELADRFTHRQPVDQQRLAPWVDRARDTLADALDTGGESALGDRLTALDDAVRAVRDGRYPHNDAGIAELIVSLTAPPLRDAMLAPDDPATRIATENLAYFLWQFSTEPDAGRLAALIAALAYQRGDSSAAHTALAAATQQDAFTRLLTAAINLRVPSAKMAELGRHGAQETRRALRPTDPA